MTDIDIEAIRKRAEAATEGPWFPGCHVSPGSICQCTSILCKGIAGSICQITVGNGLPIGDGGNDAPEAVEAIANSLFIAHARTDIPALLSHIAAQDAAHEAELVALAEYAYHCYPPPMTAGTDRTVGQDIIARFKMDTAYRAQKEKASVSSATTHPATQANTTAGER